MNARVGRVTPRALLAGGLLGVYVLGQLLTAWLEYRSGVREFAAITAITLVTGLSPIGPAYVDYALRDGGVTSTGLALLAWPNTWAWYLLLGLVFVPLLFPDGRLPSRRWRPLAWLAGVTTGAACLFGALAETITTQGARHQLPNPIGIAGLAYPEESVLGAVLGAGALVSVAGAFSALVVRFRRAHGQERLQVTWLLYALGIVFVTLLTEPLQYDLAEPAQELITGLAFNALPLAITVAILRYRLFAIDRIVSRTISYAAVTLVIVASYAAGVLLLGQLLAPLGAGNELAVAGSTLVAAGIFRPVLGRVRSVVDRRFNRSRYDAALTVEAFAQHLRDEVDLAALIDELRVVVARTVGPQQVGLWPPGGRR